MIRDVMPYPFVKSDLWSVLGLLLQACEIYQAIYDRDCFLSAQGEVSDILLWDWRNLRC